MVLERFEDINIKDLVIEVPPTPERKLFDPEQELNKKDWESIDNELDFYREGGGIDYLDTLFGAKALAPQRYGNIEIAEEVWKNVRDGFLILSPGERRNERFHYASNIRVFSEEEFKKFSIIRNNLNQFNHIIDDLQGDYFTSLAHRIYKKIIFPYQSIEFTSQEWLICLKQLDELLDQTTLDTIFYASCLKLCDPKKYSEIEERYQPRLLKLGRKKLEQKRVNFGNNGTVYFPLETALSLYILSAAKTEITPRGYVITPGLEEPQIDLATHHELPLRRAF